MKNLFIMSSRLEKIESQLRDELKRAREEIDALKLSVWKLENPPKFKFGDKVLFVPRRDSEYKTKTDTLIVKGVNHVGRRWLISALELESELESEFERFYFVEKGNSIITISEDDLVRFVD